MTAWEAAAVVLGIAYLLLAVREHISCWYAAFASTTIYLFLFWEVSLVMESLLQLYYMAMAVYGWWHWQHGRQGEDAELPISRWNTNTHLLAIGATNVSAFAGVNGGTVDEVGLSLIEPGAVCSDICHVINEHFESMDLLKYRSFGYGHSFGVLSHYYGREAGLELREDIDTVLEPGMVVSIEPMLTIPNGQPGAGGYREHDILIVTSDGAENITKFPYGPEHNIIPSRTALKPVLRALG